LSEFGEHETLCNMTIDNKKPAGDIIQATHENDAEAERVVLLGKTTASEYLPFLVDSDGVLI